MTTTLRDLMNKLEEAKSVASEAKNERDDFLEPILWALGATGGGISNCRKNRDELSITRSGSCRGCSWDDDYEFPISIFEADDPMAAAVAYKAAKEKAEADAERAEKLGKIARLQKELAEEKK